MVEITAKQLYDIYGRLPDPHQWHQKYCYMRYPKDDNALELEFEVDESKTPFEWKPTVDLIVKC